MQTKSVGQMVSTKNLIESTCEKTGHAFLDLNVWDPKLQTRSWKMIKWMNKVKNLSYITCEPIQVTEINWNVFIYI